MQRWIIEADIYRLKKAMDEASGDQHTKLAQHLRRAEAQLASMDRRGVAG